VQFVFKTISGLNILNKQYILEKYFEQSKLCISFIEYLTQGDNLTKKLSFCNNLQNSRIKTNRQL